MLNQSKSTCYTRPVAVLHLLLAEAPLCASDFEESTNEQIQGSYKSDMWDDLS